MKDLKKLFKECKEELDVIGVDYGKINSVDVNNEFTKTWGMCKYKTYSSNWKTCVYNIEISAKLLQDDVPTKSAKNVLIHEILHTCEDCMCHTGEWKRLANLVNDCYSCYNIKRCSSNEEYGVEINHDDFKYELQCTECGHIFGHHRMCRSIQHPEYYKCNCGGKLKRIK